MNYGDGKPKSAYTWDFDGACAPDKASYSFITFTLGIFQWIPKNNGKGVKRGKVIKRIKGYTSLAQEAYIKATETVEKMNSEKVTK